MRPDQKKFDELSRHFCLIDERLQVFCVANNFVLKKNIGRLPCRELHKSTDFHSMIGIHLHDYWLSVDSQQDLLHDFGVAAVHRSENSECLAKRVWIKQEIHFADIIANLEVYLLDGLRLLSSWEREPISQSNGWLGNI